MLKYYQDPKQFLNYLILESQSLRVIDMDTNLLQCVTSVKIFPNITLGSADRSMIEINLILEEDPEDRIRDILQDIMGNTRLQTIRINRYCYTSSYVDTCRERCLNESQKLYVKLSQALITNNIKHRFDVKVSWGGVDERMVTTVFIPESIQCSWYTQESQYFPVSEDMFYRCLVAALLSVHAMVYYNVEYDTDKTLKYLISKGIFTDLQTINSKVSKYTFETIL